MTDLRNNLALVFGKWAEQLRSGVMLLFGRFSIPRWLVFLSDATVVFLTFFFAYLLRFNFDLGFTDLGIVLRQALFALSIYCCFELLFRSFAGLIRHTTIKDIFDVFITTTSSMVVLVVLVILLRQPGVDNVFSIPISILVIHYIAVSAILFFVRILIKMFYEVVSVKPVSKRNVIIFGAGAMGGIVRRVIVGDTESNFHIVAFLDNNKQLQHKSLSGIQVLSPLKLTKEFLEKNQIKTMIFAIRNIPPNEKSDLYQFAVNLGLEVLEVPAVNTWLDGSFQIAQLKKIKVQDLLPRDPIQLNMREIARGLKGKRILVTGAAGSIGSELARQLTRFDSQKIILVDNAETPMFQLENELQERFGFAPVRTILGDVTDQVKMDRIFMECRPEIVFHAAAYKHVPLMEENPHEAIRVNVGSTMVLSKLSMQYGVDKFVLVSTDKAVNPTNVMGASKRICELIVRSRSMIPGNRTQFVTTRFGNVLGSNGSVIPIFMKQIEQGGPVTVTHPEITRYFMTIPEACQLVLEAGFMGRGGEIFVFEMGEPVKIADLARQMIKLSGYEPEKDIRIEYTGLRPGEKLFEELLTNMETCVPTYNPKVKVAVLQSIDPEWVLSKIHVLLCSYHVLSAYDMVSKVKEILPEYSTSNKKYISNREGFEHAEIEIYPPDFRTNLTK